MKTLITTFLFFLILISCGPSRQERLEKSIRNNIGLFDQGLFDPEYMNMYTIDKCDYIGFSNLTSNAAFLTHKGQCKNCRLQDSLLIVSIIKALK